MDLGLADKVAVVTGAGKGIGLAVTRALVDEGARVVAGSRSIGEELEALVATGRVRALALDLATPSGPAELVAAAAELGGPDVLVNNVGAVTPRLDGFLAVTDDEWFTSLTRNLMTAVRTTRAALPAMLAKGAGAIVTISSVNAFLPDPTVVDYGAAKAALSNFGKALSKEFGPRGIRVNTISPGPVATDLWLGDDGVAAAVGKATGNDPAAIAASAVAGTATGRFTRPDQVADLAVLLAGERADNVTGADFVIDGGLVTTL
jgi:NAD(P)-dependent dehydrogenase (short-subunit alcohol dehydrogenase family)